MTDRRTRILAATFAGLLVVVVAVLLVAIRGGGKVARTSDRPAAIRYEERRPNSVTQPAAATPTPGPEGATTGSLAAPLAAPPSDNTQLVDQWFGRVTDAASGLPVPDAHISLFSSFKKTDLLKPIELLRETVTDGNGEYRIPVETRPDPTAEFEDILRVRAAGHATVVAWERRRTKNENLRRDFALGAGGFIAGVVVDEQGVPVADAQIGLLILDRMNDWWNKSHTVLSTGEVTRSDANGRFRLDDLGEGKSYRLPTIGGGEFLPAVTDSIPVGSSDARIVLKRGDAKLRVTVVDSRLRPIPGCEVSVSPTKWDPVSQTLGFAMIQRAIATTSDKGFCEIVNLQSGNVFVTPEVPELMQTNRGAGRQIELKPGIWNETRFVVPDPVIIEGLALDVESRAPVAGVHVFANPFRQYGDETEIWGESPLREGDVVTKQDGRFRISSNPHGWEDNDPYLQYIAPDGWVDVTQRNETEGQVTLTKGLQEGALTAELLFKKGSMLKVLILEPDGKPAAGARIEFQQFAGVHVGSFARRTAAADGTADFTVTEGSMTIVKAFSDAAYGAERLPMEEGDPIPNPLTVRMHEFGSVSGRVTKQDDSPAAGLAVHASSDDTLLPTSYELRSDKTATTDAEGRYVVDGLPAGTVTISVSSMTEDAVFCEPREEDLADGQKLENIDFKLMPMATLFGEVVDLDQQPLKDAVIIALVGERVHSALTDADGRYEIEGLPREEPVTTISVQREGYSCAGTTGGEMRGPYLDGYKVSDVGLDFVMSKNDSFEVEVSYQDGRACTEFNYTISSIQRAAEQPRPISEFTQRSISSKNGRFTLNELWPGSFRIDVTDIGPDGMELGGFGAEKFTLSPETDTELIEVKLSSAGAIQGRVILAGGGAAVSSAEVSLFYEDPQGREEPTPVTATSADDGSFSFEQLRPGNYTVSAKAPSLISEREVELEVKPGTTGEPVALEMMSCGIIHGSVLGDGHKPRVGMHVMAELQYHSYSPTNYRETRTNEKGEYRFENLRPGEYHLYVQNMSSLTTEFEKWDLRPGEEKEINFDLSGRVTLQGAMTVAGKPWKGDETISLRALTASGSGEEKKDFPFIRSTYGNYRCELPPGEYELMVYLGSYVSLDKRILIQETPPDQFRDFDILKTSVTVKLTREDEGQVPAGHVMLMIENGADEPFGRTNESAPDPTVEFDGLPPGRYKAGFASNSSPDGNQLVGESDWVDIREDAHQEIIVVLQKPASRTFEIRKVIPKGDHYYRFMDGAGNSITDPENTDDLGYGNGATVSQFSVPGGAKAPDGSARSHPQVNGDTGETYFRVTLQTNSNDVHLVGDFTNWQIIGEYRMSLVE